MLKIYIMLIIGVYFIHLFYIMFAIDLMFFIYSSLTRSFLHLRKKLCILILGFVE